MTGTSMFDPKNPMPKRRMPRPGPNDGRRRPHLTKLREAYERRMAEWCQTLTDTQCKRFDLAAQSVIEGNPFPEGTSLGKCIETLCELLPSAPRRVLYELVARSCDLPPERVIETVDTVLKYGDGSYSERAAK